MEKTKYYIVYQITNKINDYVYIGVHITERINDKYFGSGSNIKKAIKNFGKENFEKIILYNFETKEKMLEKERELVNEEFIARGDTYNIILGGGDFKTINLITVKDKDDNTFDVHKTDPRYLSGELVGATKNTITVKDKNGDCFRIPTNDPRYLSGELVSYSKDKVTVKDKNNNYYQISLNHPKYLSGEYIHLTTGMVSVKDKYNNTLQVSVDDPRYLSGELVSIWKGKRHNAETIKKMSIAKKGKYTGKENSQFDKCWIYNDELKENKSIKKIELTNWVKKGWLKGRKMKL